MSTPLPTTFDNDLLRAWFEGNAFPPLEDGCPECGQSLNDVLAAGCMPMVMRVLEIIGKRIVQRPRSRYQELGDRPFEVAHTLWPVEERHVRAALERAWDHVPLLLYRYTGIDDRGVAYEIATALDRVVLTAVNEKTIVRMLDVRLALTPIVPTGG